MISLNLRIAYKVKVYISLKSCSTPIRSNLSIGEAQVKFYSATSGLGGST